MECKLLGGMMCSPWRSLVLPTHKYACLFHRRLFHHIHDSIHVFIHVMLVPKAGEPNSQVAWRESQDRDVVAGLDELFSQGDALVRQRRLDMR